MRLVLTDATQIDDVLDVLDAGLLDPACPDRPTLLVDTRRSTSLAERSADEIRHAVRQFQRRTRIGRRAFLATDGVRYGMGRMAITFSQLEGGESRVFVDEPEAIAWLNGGPPRTDGITPQG